MGEEVQGYVAYYNIIGSIAGMILVGANLLVMRLDLGD